MTATFKFCGVCGVHPKGLTLRTLWLMYCGKMFAIRQHVLLQSCVLFNDKLDPVDFLYHGSLGGREVPLITDPELQRKVDEATAVMIAEREAKEKAAVESARHLTEPVGRSRMVVADAAAMTICPACDGKKFVLKGRAKMQCRQCRGRGKVGS